MQKYYSRDLLDERIGNLQGYLQLLHGLTFLVGFAVFGICIWIRFDLDFQQWVREIDWYTYWYCMYVIMIAEVFGIFNSGLAFWAIRGERIGFIFMNSMISVLIIVMELIGAIVILVFGVEESTVLVDQLHDVFIELVYKWDDDPRASRVLRQIQEYVGCCGADGSDDFINAMKPVPPECRDMITGVEYAYGCQQQLAWWLEPWSATLAALCIFLLIVHILQLILESKLRGAIRECQNRDGGNIEYE